MYTSQDYLKKSVKLAVVIIASLIASLVALVILAYLILPILPGEISLGLVLATFYFKEEIGCVILLIILIYLGYKAYRVYKTEKSFSQELIKMTPSIIIWVLILGCGASFLERTFDNTNCQEYNHNEKLNGGIKEFNGKKYTINICGNGGHIGGGKFIGENEFDRVKLEVLGEQGELLAKRRYSVRWSDQPGHEPIKLQQDKIIYWDDADAYDGPKSIPMPPTRWEWLRARLPFFN